VIPLQTKVGVVPNSSAESAEEQRTAN
jgi:hypothetical protein